MIRIVYDFFARSDRASSALQKIRMSNPTCVIKESSLVNITLGNYVTILDGTYIKDVAIGDFSYVSMNSSIINASIDKFCSIGQRVQVGLAPHPTRVFVSTYPAFYSKSNNGCAYPLRQDSVFDESVPRTTIGNDVWIGTNVIVPGGISIGNGSVIAAGSVVVKDVPPYAIVGGNPAKVIRYRFSPEQIDSLIESAWWDWPIEIIKEKVDYFLNIEKFIDHK